MKKTMFAMAVLSSVLAFGQEAVAPAVAPDAAKVERKAKIEARMLGLSVEEYKKLSPDEVKTKLAYRKMERMAKKYGMTVEEYQKLTPEECKAKEKAFREQRETMKAKSLGLTFEEYQKLTPAERRQKAKACRAKADGAAKACAGKACAGKDKAAPEVAK